MTYIVDTALYPFLFLLHVGILRRHLRLIIRVFSFRGCTASVLGYFHFNFFSLRPACVTYCLAAKMEQKTRCANGVTDSCAIKTKANKKVT